jgi:hypothetical protein
MRKIMLILICSLLPSEIFGQIKASRLTVDAKNIIVANTNTYYDDVNGYRYSSDTSSASFSLSVISGLQDSGRIISYHDSETYHYYPGSTVNTFNKQDVLIIIDTLAKKINISASYSSLDHYSEINYQEYWRSNSGNLSIRNVPYILSKGADSLFVRLSSSSLKSNYLADSLLISQGFESSTTHTYSYGGGGPIVSITDSAYVNIIITGSFPLSVSSFPNNQVGFIIDPSSKILKIFGTTSYYNLPLPCFDLLGRKHNLEFLGTNGSVSTYSVRSLPAGVYFVSDGREMVKFLISE